ncbi:hypothetical protein MD484_g6423, partial [Candolleomyces efflorescens]
MPPHCHACRYVCNHLGGSISFSDKFKRENEMIRRQRYVVAFVEGTSNTHPDRKFCRHFVRVISIIGSKVSVLVIDVICTMRIYALYGRDRKLLWFLIVISIAESIIGLYCVIRVTDFAGIPPPPKSELSKRFGCPLLGAPVSADMRKWYIVTWVFSTGNASVFFLLQAFKLKDSLKDENGNVRFEYLRHKAFVSPILVAFVKDGTLNFLMQNCRRYVFIGGHVDLSRGILLPPYMAMVVQHVFVRGLSPCSQHSSGRK